jgi:hypothetical protein
MITTIKSKKCVTTLLAFCALLSLSNSAKAQLLTYEGFNYPAGSILSNNVSSGIGWGLNWSIDGSSAQNGIIGSSSLSNSINPLLVTNGQSLNVGNSVIYTRQLTNTLGTPGSATTVWVSMLYLGGTAAGNESRIGFYSGMGDGNNGSLIDGNTASSSVGTVQVIDVGRTSFSGAPDTVTLYPVNSSASYQSTGVATPRGSDAAFLLLKFDLSGDANTDTVSLWVNPNLSLGVGGLGTAQAAWTTSDLDLINGIRLQAGSTGNFKIDEIRVGKTFADVTPLAITVTPTIQVSLSGANVNLSWSAADGAGFSLQSASNLVPPVAWSDLAPALTTNAGTVSTALPATNSQSFFRLKK